MRYFDTSFLVPLVIPESITDRVEAFFQKLPGDEPLLFSQWGRVEFASVAARLVRMREMSANDASACIAEFSRLLDRSFLVHSPSLHDFQQAHAFVQHFETGLRAGDALHLAIAANQGADAICTLDTGLAEAGRRLKMKTCGLD